MRGAGGVMRGWAIAVGVGAVLGLGGFLAGPDENQAGGQSAPAAGATPAPVGPDIKFIEEDDDDGAAKKAPRNPFGGEGGVSGRKDAVPGYIEVSTGLKVPGRKIGRAHV